MSVNTFAEIKEGKNVFTLSVHNADTGGFLYKYTFFSLKQAIRKYIRLRNSNDIEYGLWNVKLKTDIVLND